MGHIFLQDLCHQGDGEYLNLQDPSTAIMYLQGGKTDAQTWASSIVKTHLNDIQPSLQLYLY